MAEIINYIWQSSFCLLFFFGVYWCFLKDEKAFTLTRAFILIAPVMALLFPLVEIPVDFAKPSISLENTEFLQTLTAFQEEEEIAGTFGLPEFTVKGSKLPLLLELKDYFLIGYLIIVFFLGFRLFWQFLQLNQLLRKGWYQTTFKLKGNYFLVPTFGMSPIFSFFDKLFWDDTQTLRADEKEHIIQHEIEHIRQRHSWDVIYYQVLSTLFWFNPAIHLMKSALVDTHEFLADEKVIRGTGNTESYRKLIVKIAFKGLDLPIGNYFIRSTTLKRIIMMKKSSKINTIKLLMVLPLTAMLLALVSMKTMPAPPYLSEGMTEHISQIKRQIVAAQDSIEVTTKVKKINSPVHYEYVSGLKNGKVTAQLGNLQYEIGEISNSDEYRKVLEMIRVFKGNSSHQKKYDLPDLVKQADNMPEPMGGMETWNKFLSTNLKFPPEARELGADGTVYAEFIVDKEGNLMSPIIKKSLGMGLDDEVLRILSLPSVPKWTPGENDGKAVNTVMTIPVRFKSDQMAETTPFFPLPPSPPSRAPEILNGEEIFDVVEEMPIPDGGTEGWNAYLSSNLKYPETAKEANIEGTVYVSLVVDKEGRIVDPYILRGIGGGADEEALRVISNSPPWKPGMQRGQKVHVKVRIPVRFKLPNENNGNDASVPNQMFNKDQGTKKAGNLDEVVVIGYGSSPGYISKNSAESNNKREISLKGKVHLIDVFFQNNDQVLLRGRKVKMEDMPLQMLEEAKKLEAKGLDKSQVVGFLKINKNIKSELIHQVQEIFRKHGIQNFIVDSTSHNQTSPVLIFEPQKQ